jgi:hypothetical protein
LTPSSSLVIRTMSADRIRLSVARWMRLPIASGAVSAARMPATTRSTGTRFSSAVGSPGKPVATVAMSQPFSRPMGSVAGVSRASFARPKALMGAFTTLVSPRLFPVRESPITIDGRSCATRRPAWIR